MFGTVQDMNPSKSGASYRLRLNGKWLVAGNRVNLDGVHKGTYVEYEEGSFPGNDGKPVLTVARIRPAQPPQSPANGSGVPQAGSTITDGDILRSVSNVLGQVCAAGKISTPAELSTWFVSAYQGFTCMQKWAERDAAQSTNQRQPPAQEEFVDDELPPDYGNLPPPKERARW